MAQGRPSPARLGASWLFLLMELPRAARHRSSLYIMPQNIVEAVLTPALAVDATRTLRSAIAR
jgi:hypothetical protein